MDWEALRRRGLLLVACTSLVTAVVCLILMVAPNPDSKEVSGDTRAVITVGSPERRGSHKTLQMFAARDERAWDHCDAVAIRENIPSLPNIVPEPTEGWVYPCLVFTHRAPEGYARVAEITVRADEFARLEDRGFEVDVSIDAAEMDRLLAFETRSRTGRAAQHALKDLKNLVQDGDRRLTQERFDRETTYLLELFANAPTHLTLTRVFENLSADAEIFLAYQKERSDRCQRLYLYDENGTSDRGHYDEETPSSIHWTADDLPTEYDTGRRWGRERDV